MSDPVLYSIFAVIVAVLLAIDLFVVQRDTHAVSIKEAAIWSSIWIGVSILFGLTLTRFHHNAGPTAVAEWFSGYVIEKSLSVDNVFVFVLIFSAFKVPRELQHRVLFYGVLGAIVMRTILIFTGAALIARFEWILYVFGAFLLYIAWRTWRERNEESHITDSRVMARVRKVVPATKDYRGERFFVRENAKRLATPLFIVLLFIEFSDLIFAVDSIPAIFAVTRDPFIVLTSNIFAILGLRSLYFLLAGAADELRYLQAGLAVILAFVGVKLLTEGIEGIWHPNPLQSLAVILVILVITVVASLVQNRRERDAEESEPAEARPT